MTDAQTRIEDAAARVEVAADILEQVANGDDAVEVPTASGPRPSIAKWFKDRYDEFYAWAEGILVACLDAAGLAASAAATAEAARDAANVLGRSYPSTAAGIAATTNEQYFSVPKAAPNNGFLDLYKNNAGVAQYINSYPSQSLIDSRVAESELAQPSETVDDYGNRSHWVNKEGVFRVADLDADGTPWGVVTIGNDDQIIHIGDSFTAGHWNIPDKNFVSHLSQVSPYRHVNFGVSGDDALGMQKRLIDGSTSNGEPYRFNGSRYAIITSSANDAYMRSVKFDYYVENLRRVADAAMAAGAKPIMATEFPNASLDHAAIKRLADEMGVDFVDCTSLNRELDGLDNGPFFQGHPGVRNNGVMWLPMLNYIRQRLPAPTRAIKIFRKRATFAAGAVSDLLYSDLAQRLARWKEISIFNQGLSPWQKYDSLMTLGTYGPDYTWVATRDEYQRLQRGRSVAFTDYGLIEASLPITAATGKALRIQLNMRGTATVYIRDYLNTADAMPGKRDGILPTTPQYVSGWNVPRGRWQAVTLVDGVLILNGNVDRYMHGHKLCILLAGAFTLHGVEVKYKGREVARTPARLITRDVGANLLTQPLCGNAGQLAGWTVQGAPVTQVPIDVSMAPRNIAGTAPVDGVVYINATDTIRQTATLPALSGVSARYKITVWARYFPKAFIKPSDYPGLDSAQVIDKEANPSGSEVTPDTNDWRTLQAEIALGNSISAAGGLVCRELVHMCWQPVEFFVDRPAWNNENLTFRLSCPDGEVQVGKVFVNEVMQWA